MLLGFILNDRKSKIAMHWKIGLYAVICYIILHALESKLYIIDLVHISDFIIKLYPYLLLSYSPYDVNGIRSRKSNENDRIFLIYSLHNL